MGIVAETRWDFGRGQTIRHLKDIEYRHSVFERKRQPKLTNLGLLFVKVKNVLPLFHHSLRIQCRARDWNPSYIDGSNKPFTQVHWILESAIRCLNLIVSKDELFLFIQLDWEDAIGKQKSVHRLMDIRSAHASITTAVLVHLSSPFVG